VCSPPWSRQWTLSPKDTNGPRNSR
jgi:hypothetical protein